MARKKSKKLEELTPEELGKLKIEFAPGCFDNFDGTQEELDDLIKEITEMVRTGDLHKKARRLDPDDLNEEDLEVLRKVFEQESDPRKLQ